jgi:Permuted papain-like amidase enzyme, YaeF/YiiX, C92 family
MKYKKQQSIIKIRWLFCYLILFSASCNRQVNEAKPKQTSTDSFQTINNSNTILMNIVNLKSNVLSGDVVTRTGNDFTSQCLKSLNRNDKTFSHCGIASIENDSLFVYHAIGGEWNPNETIKRDLFENFCNPTENNAVGVFRHKLSTEIKYKLIEKTKTLYNKNIKFDLDFDLKTDDKMYCTEFVYKSFLYASDSVVKFNHSFIKQFEFVGVDDITVNALSTQIAMLNLNK